MDLEHPAFAGAASRRLEMTPDTARLAARVAELRAQLDALAPTDEISVRRAREAREGVRETHERIAALERLLAASRDREEQLAAHSIRDQGLAADLHAEIADLRAAMARASDAEELLQEAQVRASDAGRRASMLEEQVREQTREAGRLRARAASLEADLRAAITEVAAAASDRVRAGQLERERDAAREEAEQERRRSVESRLRAAEAEARLAVFESRVSALDERLARLTALLPGGHQQEAAAEAPLPPTHDVSPGVVLDLRGVEPGAADDPDTSVPGPSSHRVQGRWPD